jgi:hypothetical protein
MDGAHTHGHGGGFGLGEIAVLVAAVFVVAGGMGAAARIVADLLTIVIIALSTVAVLGIAAAVTIAVVRSRRQSTPGGAPAQVIPYRVTSLGQPQRPALPQQASPVAQPGFSDDEAQILLAVAEAIAAKRRS